MTLQQERPLDLREFQDIFEYAKGLIPKYCPEWTDHNLSDPGITLIELFAWMTEMILYQMNRVPGEMYERFLEMVGVHRLPPVPAVAEVTFYLSTSRAGPITIPAETEVATDRTETEDAIVFATTEDLTIQPPTLAGLFAWREGQGFEDYLPYIRGLIRQEEQGAIFNEKPVEGDAFYIGYVGNLAGDSLRLRLECVELEAPGIQPEHPPLEWEYWSGESGEWAPVQLLDESGTGRLRDATATDPTHGLNKSGQVYVHIPRDSRPQTVEDVEATWIRVRYVKKGDQEYSQSPRILGLRSEIIAGSVPVRQVLYNPGEFLGESEGTPDQSFMLLERPVLRRKEPHIIDVSLGDDTTEWIEVEDFSESRETDRHFTINYLSGEVRLGPSIRSRDGALRQYGAIPHEGAVLRMRSYHSGGGIVGNVGEGAITQLKTSIPYIANVKNYRSASGGLDAESLEEAKLRSLRVLRSTEAAITGEDYERLAQEVDGVGRAHCIVPAEGNGDVTAGAVRLLLVPDPPESEEALTPEDLVPSQWLIEEVSEHIDERKILGTAIDYGQAEFVWVDVDAHVYVKRNVDPSRAQDHAVEVLRSFLHPTQGGPDARGLSFGGAVTESRIAGLLQSLSEVAYVERIRLRPQGDSRDASRIKAPAHGLLAPGRCYVLAEATDTDE